MTWREMFRVVGTLTCAVGVFLIVLLSMRDTILRNRGVDVLRIWPVVICCFVAGIGTFRCTRWGVALLALPLAGVFLWWSASALLAGSTVSFLMALVFAPVLLSPAYLGVRYWSRLSSW